MSNNINATNNNPYLNLTPQTSPLQTSNHNQSGSTSSFASVMNDVAKVGLNLGGGLLNKAIGLGTLGIGGGLGELGQVGNYAELINSQLQAQQEMQVVSMVSNIEKSKHETEMSAVRNIRAN